MSKTIFPLTADTKRRKDLRSSNLNAEEEETIISMIDERENIGFMEHNIKISAGVIRAGIKDVIRSSKGIYRIKTSQQSVAVSLIGQITLKLKCINIKVTNSILKKKNRRTYTLYVISTNKEAHPYEIEFDADTLTELKAFKKKLYETDARLVFHGREHEFVEIMHRTLSTQNVQERVIFTELGLNKEYNVWIWSNAIYDITAGSIAYKNHETGVIEFPNGRKFEVELKSSQVPTYLPLFSPESAIETCRNFFKNLVNSVDDAGVLLAFGVILAAVHADLFFEQTEGFPSVFLHGKAQVGKSTWQKVWAYIYGFSTHLNIKSGTSTAFAIRRALESVANIPAQFDEINEASLKLFETILKDSYSRVSRERGTKSGNVESMEVKTVPIISGNYLFENITEPIITRIIFSSISQKSPMLSNFKYFDKDNLSKLSIMLPLFIGNRNNIISMYEKELEFLKIIKPENQRYLHNIAIALSSWCIVFNLIGEELFDKKNLVEKYLEFYLPYLDMEVQDGDSILHHLGNFILNGWIRQDDVFRTLRNNNLRLNLGRFLGYYNNIYPNKQMSVQQLRVILGADARFNLNATPSGNVGRAILVDISKEDELLDIINRRRRQQ